MLEPGTICSIINSLENALIFWFWMTGFAGSARWRAESVPDILIETVTPLLEW